MLSNAQNRTNMFFHRFKEAQKDLPMRKKQIHGFVQKARQSLMVKRTTKQRTIQRRRNIEPPSMFVKAVLLKQHVLKRVRKSGFL